MSTRQFQVNEQLRRGIMLIGCPSENAGMAGVVVHSIRLCLIGSNVIASEGENDGLVFWELALTTDLRRACSLSAFRVSSYGSR
jgi:hypothetical protein